ncbi:MAG: poly(R)-hydroxyalkanoic acid synthase subunit PhaE [Motiliproteus sp.]
MDSNQLEQLQQWLESQKAHWQSLLGDGTSAPADWQAVIQSCQNLSSQQTPDQAELTASMAQQIKGFSQYGEQLLRALHQADSTDSSKASAEATTGDSAKNTQNTDFEIDQAVKTFSSHLHQQASEPFYRQLQLPDAMQQPLHQLLQQLGLSPSEFTSFPFLHQGVGSQQSDQREKLLKISQTLTEFSDSMRAYSKSHQQINQLTSQLFSQKLHQQAPPGTLNELHSLWVDCYEQNYQQQLHTDDYQHSYGRFCNATLSLQKQLRHYWQNEQRIIGLVPYHDYDQLLQSHHKLRKSHKQSQQKVKQLLHDSTHQQQRIDALEQQLQTLINSYPTNTGSQH